MRGSRTEPCLAERDDGLTFEEPIPPYLEDKKDWSSQEKDALSSVGRSILDLGCGPGRHLLSLQEESFVVGLDTSPGVLQTCKMRGGQNLVLGCARRLPFKAQVFDTVLLMTNGLGIAGGMPETLDMLRDVVRVMVPEGVVIAHTTDPLKEESRIEREYTMRNIRNGKPPGLVKVRLRYKGVVGRWFEILLLSPREVETIFSAVSLRVKRSIPWRASTIYVAGKG